MDPKILFCPLSFNPDYCGDMQQICILLENVSTVEWLVAVNPFVPDCHACALGQFKLLIPEEGGLPYLLKIPTPLQSTL